MGILYIFGCNKMTRKICLIFCIFLFVSGEFKEAYPEQKQREVKKSEFAVREYQSAVQQAENDNPNGFLKLYEIATNDLIYTVEISQVSNEKLHYLLYSKTELWIRTFAKTDLDKFKKYLKWSGMEVSELPRGVASDEQFREIIFNKLKKMRGDKKETELISYLFELYGKKMQ